MCMNCAELFKTNVYILVDNVYKFGDKVFITSKLVEKNFITFLSSLLIPSKLHRVLPVYLQGFHALLINHLLVDNRCRC